MVPLRLYETLFNHRIASSSTHDMRFHDFCKSAPCTLNHASEITAATGDPRVHGNGYHEHQHIECGHTEPTTMQIRQHAPEHDHPTGRGSTCCQAPAVGRDLAPSLLAADGARAARARGSIGELSGVRLGLVARLAGERFGCEAYRSSFGPSSTIWMRQRDTSTSSEWTKQPAVVSAAMRVVGSECSAASSTTTC